MDELLARGWVEEAACREDGRRVHLAPTEAGTAALAGRGVDVPAGKFGRPVAFACTDWTERRWHLGGALGRAVVDAMEEAGSLSRGSGTRVVRLAVSPDSWLYK